MLQNIFARILTIIVLITLLKMKLFKKKNISIFIELAIEESLN
jgi:hypothetical protein